MFIIRHIKYFLIAIVIIFVVAIGVVASLGIPLGIDFTGGALTEVSYTKAPEKDVLQMALSEVGGQIGLGGFSLRPTTEESGRSGYMLRTKDLAESDRQAIDTALTAAGEGGEIVRFTSIGPVIGEELKDKAVWALIAVSAVIVLYVAFAFRGISKPVSSWGYGGITVFALIHDVLVAVAAMSVLGYLYGAEADILFVVALLTILGYSVNDTIVVFDRVRENLMLYRQGKKVKKDGEETVEYILTKPFDAIVGEAVTQTLGRSINTSLTTLLAICALFFFGGEVTRNFALILGVGVIAGTYSSICIANPLLVAYATWKAKKEKPV